MRSQQFRSLPLTNSNGIDDVSISRARLNVLDICSEKTDVTFLEIVTLAGGFPRTKLIKR
ncbi:hypothetical protein P5673_022724 [Acropora cervicornis]|uniref:Uncharacterized protein n=1 Tax=Acropora cervicornis TaxID=6130 RepID=A0AAD9UZI2_ACRCE|nr:hypothetical protein P5673_022724 [Acropora cervicornis]